MNRGSFTFYYEFLQTALFITDADLRRRFLEEVVIYGLTGEEPEESVSPIGFYSIKCRLDSQMHRHTVAVENGKKGGRPKKNNEGTGSAGRETTPSLVSKDIPETNIYQQIIDKNAKRD